MKENLTKIENFTCQGQVTTERILILATLLLNYVDGEKTMSTVLEIILEQAEEIVKIFEEIEMLKL